MSAPVRPGLLVSVRSAAEAEAALAGGADLIDVKEPSRGSLGRADDEVIEEVIRVVAGRKPVSVAMGEVLGNDSLCWSDDGTTASYFKWGFADYGDRSREEQWELELEVRFIGLTSFQSMVPVAYADWPRSNSPEPEVLCSFARHFHCGAFLVDTQLKDGSTLLDWMQVHQIALLTKLCHQDSIRVALAGSLGPKEIKALAHLKPDWFAVRGAACSGGREGTVDVEKVRELKMLLQV